MTRKPCLNEFIALAKGIEGGMFVMKWFTIHMMFLNERNEKLCLLIQDFHMMTDKWFRTYTSCKCKARDVQM